MTWLPSRPPYCDRCGGACSEEEVPRHESWFVVPFAPSASPWQRLKWGFRFPASLTFYRELWRSIWSKP